ncbi:hypothetical protein PILCRDRAFT_5084 [Piloderma croceum F 1598]|uniref:Uncharacterized protein n=1 Tax=Piloderma croceum (strain F 1598) TaxID=765440 RepID=A0A0C3BI68_PILCF|nr:hypothetical protein PILCRDRAFT_5084 [Piloderma croceum F 1598]
MPPTPTSLQHELINLASNSSKNRREVGDLNICAWPLDRSDRQLEGARGFWECRAAGEGAVWVGVHAREQVTLDVTPIPN